jgi:type IV secretory pathway TrbF-like protein
MSSTGLTEYPVSPPTDIWRENTDLVNATMRQMATREAALLRTTRNLWWAVGSAGMLLGILIYSVTTLANNKTVIPYIYELDNTGHLREVGMLQRGWKGDTTKPVEAAMADWLYRMRRVGTDAVLLREQMEFAGAFMTHKAAQLAKAHWKEVDKLVAEGMVTTVTLGEVLPITPDFRSAEVEWVEKVYNQQGIVVPDRSGKWKVIANIAMVPVTEIKDQRQTRNILGIFITDFAWRKVGKL